MMLYHFSIEEGRKDKQGSPVANEFYGQITAKKRTYGHVFLPGRMQKDSPDPSRDYVEYCIYYIINLSFAPGFLQAFTYLA